MSDKTIASQACIERCEARMPGSDHSTAGKQCGLFAGHDGDHTLLMPSNAPWLDPKWKQPASAAGPDSEEA